MTDQSGPERYGGAPVASSEGTGAAVATSHAPSATATDALPGGRVYRRELPRRLGVWSATAGLVGLIVGSGIFRVPSSVAANVDSVGAIAGVWLLGGLFALFGALTFAELAAMFPRPGGVYVFLRETFGTLPAFLYGWTHLLVLRPAATGAFSLIFASYAGHWVGLSPTGERWLACGVIVVAVAFNYRSVLLTAMVENAMTAAKVVALFALAFIAFVLGDRADGALATAPSLGVSDWGAFGLALVTVMWTYSGWGVMTGISGEVKDPGRNLPRALTLGVLTVIGVYIATNAAYLYLLPMDEMAASSAVAADAASRILGPSGAGAIAALVMLSTFGALLASTLFGPRIYYAMARDGLLFGRVGNVHANYETPHIATLLVAALGIAFVSLRTFEQLANAFVLGSWPFYILAVLGVFRLRKRKPDLPRPYRTLGYPFVPLAFLALSVAMLLNAVVEQPGLTLYGFAIILLGIPWYWIQRRMG